MNNNNSMWLGFRVPSCPIKNPDIADLLFLVFSSSSPSSGSSSSWFCSSPWFFFFPHHPFLLWLVVLDDETLPTFIKKKAPKKGREKETRGKDQSQGKQAAKKRQVTRSF
jgi:hypothetical protein